MTEIVLRTHVDAPPLRCFDLARHVDEHIASTRGTAEKAVDGVTAGTMGFGDSVTFEARHFAKRWRMTSRITKFDSPHVFVDEQTDGPFRSWYHEHRFEPTERGCLIVDHIRYEPPFGPLGSLVDVVFLRRYMTRLVERRAAHLKAVAESGV